MTAAFCPQCGWLERADEDGCCLSCGCVAVGDGVEEAAAMRIELEQLRAVASAARAMVESFDHDYLVEGLQVIKFRLRLLREAIAAQGV